MFENMSAKEQLYLIVRWLKDMQFRRMTGYGINVVDFVSSLGVQVQALPFKTPGFRGVAVPGVTPGQKDIILLNSSRDSYQQNFDCAHEMMHLCLHSKIKRDPFVCQDEYKPNQDAFMEWQANEGAAEYCVPYLILLRMIKERYDDICKFTGTDFEAYCQELSEVFMVPKMVIKIRIESLKYEIYQYTECGIPLNEVKLMSKKELERNRIKVPSLYFKVLGQDLAAREYQIS